MTTTTTGGASAPPAPQTHAIAYAERGWPIFPLWPIRGGRCSCPDPDCDNAGKHPVPTRWQRTIASVPAAEAQWRDPLGDRGIGAATGERLGAWVLDPDKDKGGLEALARLEHDYGPLPTSWRVRTGGGGLHIYFAWPDGPPITNRDAGLPAGINVRGQGGYVVLPPTLHETGQRYHWLTAPDESELAPAPDWLLELIRQPQRALPATDTASGDEAALIPAGKRHQALVAFCGLLRSGGLYEETIVRCGLAFLELQCEQEPAMDLKRATRTMRDVARRYPSQVNRR